jgi:hypothetical protein
MAKMKHASWLVGGLLAVLAAACSGSKPAPETARPQGPETRWLRGLSATEVKTAVSARALVCEGPAREGGTNVWTCTAATPLVSYRVRFYGSAPLKLEYLTATVTQVGPPKIDLVQPLFVAIAGLHFEGADAPKAREWVLAATTAGGGETAFGPAKFRVSGDLGKMTLDIKASGSDW